MMAGSTGSPQAPVHLLAQPNTGIQHRHSAPAGVSQCSSRSFSKLSQQLTPYILTNLYYQSREKTKRGHAPAESGRTILCSVRTTGIFSVQGTDTACAG